MPPSDGEVASARGATDASRVTSSPPLSPSLGTSNEQPATEDATALPTRSDRIILAKLSTCSLPYAPSAERRRRPAANHSRSSACVEDEADVEGGLAAQLTVEAVAPFDDQDAALGAAFREPQAPDLDGCLASVAVVSQSVKVAVKEHAARGLVLLDERERRAGDRLLGGYTELPRDRAREERLSGPQVAGQKNEISWLQEVGDPYAKARRVPTSRERNGECGSLHLAPQNRTSARTVPPPRTSVPVPPKAAARSPASSSWSCSPRPQETNAAPCPRKRAVFSAPIAT